jgi:hypothetical protein
VRASIKGVLAGARCGCRGAGALPADVVARASRRRRGGLGQVEGRAIMTALRAADG